MGHNLMDDLQTFGQRLVTSAGTKPEEEDVARLAHALLGAALALLLTGQGWRIDTSPGMPVVLRHAEDELEPFQVPSLLLEGRLTPDQWQGRCAALGITAVDLGGWAASLGTSPVQPMAGNS